MSKHRPPNSLYSMALERLQLLIADYSVHLAVSDCKTTELHEIIEDWKGSVSARLPRHVLEDVVNSFNGAILKCSRELCFFYLLTLRTDFQRLVMSKVNSQFSIYEWNELFVRTPFDQLTWLDCGRNCTDHVLYLISLNCPNLEYLNALSRRRLFPSGGNATLLHDRITDTGVDFIAQRCRKLKTLVMNDPRNGSDRFPGEACCQLTRNPFVTVSSSGYRMLLRAITSLECISYANIGGIIATGLEDVKELNLRLIQHYSPTEESMKEIIRLCPKMEKLHLVSFLDVSSGSGHTNTVLDEVFKGRPSLTAINFKNMAMRERMSILCDTFMHLTELQVTESFEYLSVDNLITIGTQLPYLKHLHLLGYCPESAAGDAFRNHKFCGQLEDLNVSFIGKYSEPALRFCVSNSEETLQHCTLTVDTAREENIVRRLMERHSFPVLYELTLFPGFLTTMEEVLDLITHFPKLQLFTGWCLGDITPIACLIQEHNLNFTFTNISNRTMLDYVGGGVGAGLGGLGGAGRDWIR